MYRYAARIILRSRPYRCAQRASTTQLQITTIATAVAVVAIAIAIAIVEVTM